MRFLGFTFFSGMILEDTVGPSITVNGSDTQFVDIFLKKCWYSICFVLGRGTSPDQQILG